MLSTHYSDKTLSYSASSSRLDRIASWSNVDRAYWEMLEFPTKTVILADDILSRGFLCFERRVHSRIDKAKA
jgi:hypothetical protein